MLIEKNNTRNIATRTIMFTLSPLAFLIANAFQTLIDAKRMITPIVITLADVSSEAENCIFKFYRRKNRKNI